MSIYGAIIALLFIFLLVVAILWQILTSPYFWIALFVVVVLSLIFG